MRDVIHLHWVRPSPIVVDGSTCIPVDQLVDASASLRDIYLEYLTNFVPSYARIVNEFI